MSRVASSLCASGVVNAERRREASGHSGGGDRVGMQGRERQGGPSSAPELPGQAIGPVGRGHVHAGVVSPSPGDFLISVARPSNNSLLIILFPPHPHDPSLTPQAGTHVLPLASFFPLRSADRLSASHGPASAVQRPRPDAPPRRLDSKCNSRTALDAPGDTLVRFTRILASIRTVDSTTA